MVGLPLATKRSYRTAAKRVCQANFQAITEVKAAWAKAENKRADDTPRDDDLFGAGKSIPSKPTFQWKGYYSFGAIGEKPRCSIPSHTI